jgi:hypothetical protein
MANFVRPGLFTVAGVKAACRRVGVPEPEEVAIVVIGATQAVERQGRQYLRLKDPYRLSILKSDGSGVLQGSLSGESDEEAIFDDFERLFHEIYKEGAVLPRHIEQYGIEYVERTTSILRDTISSLPSPVQLQSLWRCSRRKSRDQEAHDAIFVDRETETATLVSALREPGAPSHQILELSGPAGSGKTLTIRKVLAALADQPDVCVCEIDFEKPISSDTLPQVAVQEIISSLFDLRFLSASDVELLGNLAKHYVYLNDVADLLKIEVMPRCARPLKRLILFFDSLEVYINSFGQSDAISRISEALTDAFPFLCICIATRLSSVDFGPKSHRIALRPLSKEHILQFCTLSGLDPIRSRYVLNSLPEGNPLLAALLIEAVRSESNFNLQDIITRNPFGEDMFQQYVVDRIIRKISDPLVREIAANAIPLRQITGEMLFYGPIFPAMSEVVELASGHLFNRIRKQVVFFQGNQDYINVRRDIRQTLLKLARKSEREHEYNRIRSAAKEYWLAKFSAEGSATSRLEAMYYSLCLHTSRDDLERLWDTADASQLLPHLEEYTPECAAWLKLKARRRWTPPDFKNCFEADFEPQFVKLFVDSFSNGSLRPAKRILHSVRPRISGGTIIFLILWTG